MSDFQRERPNQEKPSASQDTPPSETGQDPILHRQLLETSVGYALANPEISISDLSQAVSTYTSLLRIKDRVKEAQEITERAIDKIERPAATTPSLEQVQIRPPVATQLRLSLAEILIDQGHVYQAERMLTETYLLLKKDRQYYQAERFGVLNAIAETLRLRECDADAQRVAFQVLRLTAPTSTPERIRATIIAAETVGMVGLKEEHTKHSSSFGPQAVLQRLEEIEPIIKGILQEDPATCPPSASREDAVAEQLENILRVASIYAAVPGRDTPGKFLQNATRLCDYAEQNLNLLTPSPQRARMDLDLKILRAEILESQGSLEEALEAYIAAHEVCVDELLLVLSPEAIHLRVCIATVQLDMAGEYCDVDTLRDLDRSFAECAQDLENFPDAYDSLRLKVHEGRLRVLGRLLHQTEDQTEFDSILGDFEKLQDTYLLLREMQALKDDLRNDEDKNTEGRRR